jgi:hypothetical protein
MRLIGTRKREIMEKEQIKGDEKEIYVEPKIVATYSKKELEESIRPHGPVISTA